MKNVLFTLELKRDENLKYEKSQRSQAREYAEAADRYKAQADEYQRAIDLLEAAAATLTEPQS